MASASDLHIVTGGTGFVGSAVILELLRDPEARVVGLTRPGAEGSAQRRLHGVLEQAARLYGHGSTLDEAIATRCEAIDADLFEPRCGVEARSEWAGAELWHCAASLQFLDRYQQSIFRTNVQGSRHVAELALAAEVAVVNMVSTAYVAGTRSGEILEAPAEAEISAEGNNNHYERSKLAAEQVFTTAGLPCVRVLRPSIVIGHSQTRAALNYNGLYGFLRSIHKFRRLMERTQRELGAALEVRMIADPDARINLIPVDHVAHDAVALARAGAPAGYYHLTGARAPLAPRVLELVFESVGMRPPIFVADRESFSWLDDKFNARVDFYNAYLVGPKRFSRAHVDHYVPDSPSREFEIDDARMTDFCRWYVEGPLTERKPQAVSR